jgi:hypothetical protein
MYIFLKSPSGIVVRGESERTFERDGESLASFASVCARKV